MECDIGQEALAAIFRRSMFWYPESQTLSAWSEHVPFAFWLIDVLRPRTVVELGTHTGVSYSAMCQAVKALGLATACFAVDTWKGDAHAGLYAEDVYRDFRAFHDRHFGAFSQLIRSTFDEAREHFDDGSVDLLHIDGFHTYEAVSHDFESWRPKLSPHAVVLFHDTNVHERNFGVHRFWREISEGKPHFEFLHGYGLGVLGIGEDNLGALGFLFRAAQSADLTAGIRSMFSRLGSGAAALMADADFSQELKQREMAIAALTQQREAELNALRAHMDAAIRTMQTSTSWRVTAPLRATKKMLRILRR